MARRETRHLFDVHDVLKSAEKLHGELATWEGDYTLQVESKADHAAGTPFRITAYEHHTVAPGTCYSMAAFD